MTTEPELLEVTDEYIDEAMKHADPMVLRGLLYQLTGDDQIRATEIEELTIAGRFSNRLKNEADVAMIRAKAAAFLKAHRDVGAPKIEKVSEERLYESMSLTAGGELLEEDRELWIQQTALDPWSRGLDWKREPKPGQRENFLVAVIGCGMSGLDAAVYLKRAGIPFVVLEKNAGVGGTWFENRYPGARVDTPSRTYTHKFGAGFPYPFAYCPWDENMRYCRWVAENFGVQEHIEFNTEVSTLVWLDDEAMWEITTRTPAGERKWRVNAVISGVGLLSRPSMPNIEGIETFAGVATHTARWPADLDVTGKRVAVIGSGASGYQTTPVLAKMASHLSLFQRTPSWCFDNANYVSPLPKQIPWLEKYFPYYMNFVRMRNAWSYGPNGARSAMYADPEFEDPHAASARNKRMRDERIAFLQTKFASRPELIEKMIPPAPPMSSRPIVVDSADSVYDAILKNHVSLITDPIERIVPEGIVVGGETHPFDVIVFATGFKASDVLLPMDVRGRGGRSIHDLWAKDGPRAYIGSMAPGFPNFFMSYGPNTNNFGGFQTMDLLEMEVHFALQNIGELITHDKRTVEVSEEAYWRYNKEVDREEKLMIYMDRRVKNYYRNDFGRSCVNNPIDFRRLWRWLRDPATPKASTDAGIRPYFGEDLLVA